MKEWSVRPSIKPPDRHHKQADRLAKEQSKQAPMEREREREREKESNKQQQPWTAATSYGSLMMGFCWPPRSYPCSFCKREFRSAQALGGHMNVHRRDRARLRHAASPPPPRAVMIPNLNYPPPPPQQHHRHGRTNTTVVAAAASLELPGVDVPVCSCGGSTSTIAPSTPAAEDDGGLDLELRLGVS